MPKVKIDYSNTLFYMIFCKDENVKDLYIGHTTNFVQRKHGHKQCCLNTKANNCKLYRVMRDNGGWDNWIMRIIAFHECENLAAAKKHEQKYFQEYNATLNSIEPFPIPKPRVKKEKKIFFCDTCNVHFQTTKEHEIHNETKKHKKILLEGVKSKRLSKNTQQFECEKCDYTTSRKSQYDRHLSTGKHKMLINANKMLTKSSNEYDCICGKSYNQFPSLSRHKKTCTFIEEKEEEEKTIVQNSGWVDNELVMQLLAVNKELINIINKINVKKQI
jgi:hypothetical protein